jgi:hypothetical protein
MLNPFKAFGELPERHLLNCWNDTIYIACPVVSLYFIYSLCIQSRLMSVSCTPYSYVFEVTPESLTPVDQESPLVS